MTTKVVSLVVTCDSRQFPYEKRYPSSLTLHELKVIKQAVIWGKLLEKLVLVIGSSVDRMRMELHDKDGKFISSLTNDQATLEKLGVADGMKIHVMDTSAGNLIGYENVSAIEKYTIPEEKYNEREDSVRAWRRREGLKVKYNTLAAAENEAKQFKIGDRCMVHVPNQQEKKGVISYIGLTKFKDGYWVGVTYDGPFGKHDGSISGERYFTCENNHGAFVRPRDVRKYDEDEKMEEI